MPTPVHFDDPLRPRNPLVAHRWFFIGIVVVVVAAVLAVYGAMALLFWQGQWQLIYRLSGDDPSRLFGDDPGSTGAAYEDVRFDATEAGKPLLHGWWVPVEPSLHHRATILYLHDAHGPLRYSLPDIVALHALGQDVFAFDPRGFGKSVWAKPSEAHWNEDADAALAYLGSVRHVDARDIVVVGRGLGGTVSANLTLRHPELRSVVIVDPQPPVAVLLAAPRWTHILPVRLLARDCFDPAEALRNPLLHSLFLTPLHAQPPGYVARAAGTTSLVRSDLLGDANTALALRRFLDQAEGQRR